MPKLFTLGDFGLIKMWGEPASYWYVYTAELKGLSVQLQGQRVCLISICLCAVYNLSLLMPTLLQVRQVSMHAL